MPEGASRRSALLPTGRAKRRRRGLAVFAAHAARIIISASGRDGDQLEDLHTVLGEGPCIDAAVTGEPVTATDLDTPARAAELAASRPTITDQRTAGSLRFSHSDT